MIRDGAFSHILVARDKAGRIAGTLMFTRRDTWLPWTPVLGRVGGFGCVGVAPRARGHGIGLAMCARAMELLREKGVHRIFVAWVYLIKWYGQLGLRPWRTYRATHLRLFR
jgi:predicted N-acetyltransferase YhbS